MSIKHHVLTLLLENNDSFLSGQQIAKQLGVSRNAVWKVIKRLREQGNYILSHPQKGYKLVKVSTRLDSIQIRSKETNNWHIEIHDSVTSTNDLAKLYASSTSTCNAIFVSTHQTHGRGRYGHTFHSNIEEGLYFSVLLQPRPTLNISQVSQYTLLAASAIAQTLNLYLPSPISIKWINDLFYKNRKIGGILCEAISDVETQILSSIIIGIGLNLAGDFSHTDAKTQNVAGTIFDVLPLDFNRNLLIQQFLKLLITYDTHFDDKLYLSYYRQHLLGIGKKVTYIQQGITQTGRINGIDDNGHLLITHLDGSQSALFSHEVHFSSEQFI